MKSRDLLAVVVDRERAVEVELAAIEIGERDVAGLMNSATVEQRSEGGLPADPVVDVACEQPHPSGHHEAHRRLHVLDEVRQRVRRHLRDDAGAVDPLADRQRAVCVVDRHPATLDVESDCRQLLVANAATCEIAVYGDGPGKHRVEQLVSLERSDVLREPRPSIDRHSSPPSRPRNAGWPPVVIGRIASPLPRTARHSRRSRVPADQDAGPATGRSPRSAGHPMRRRVAVDREPHHHGSFLESGTIRPGWQAVGPRYAGDSVSGGSVAHLGVVLTRLLRRSPTPDRMHLSPNSARTPAVGRPRAEAGHDGANG